jgi:hypothetical protein
LNRLELDVAVVGGGPAGLIAAREAARRGLAVAVFEEDWAIGRPERCAGLYSVDGLRRLGIPTSGHHVQNRVRGAVFVSPSKHVFEVDAGRDVALVCNRERRDQLLAEHAVKLSLVKVLSYDGLDVVGECLVGVGWLVFRLCWALMRHCIGFWNMFQPDVSRLWMCRWSSAPGEFVVLT